MRLAILGTRGIPARYGGFETLAEELSARLAARGHDVTVYTRTRYAVPGLDRWRGARIRVLPDDPDEVPRHRRSRRRRGGRRRARALRRRARLQRDQRGVVLDSPRLGGKTRVVLNVDGLERHRRKWSLAGTGAYRISERLSTMLPDVVVSDARVIQDYYRRAIRVSDRLHPVRGRPAGAGRARRRSSGSGSSPRNTSSTSRASSRRTTRSRSCRRIGAVPGTTPLVVVGDAPYARDVHRPCPGGGGPPRPLPGRDLRRGLPASSCPTRRSTSRRPRVGGTHPALVEALGYGRVVCYHQSPENEEVAGGAGLAFDVRRPETLARAPERRCWTIRRGSPYGKSGPEREQKNGIVGMMSPIDTRPFLKAEPVIS